MVDERELRVERGRNLLQACLEHDIYVPNLCHLPDMDLPPASCRLCFVEIEGRSAPVTACAFSIQEEIRVRTDTPALRGLQRSALRLLLSVHRVECTACPANKRCELQRLAGFLKIGLKPKRLARLLHEPEVEPILPLLDFYPNRCVRCGRCVHVCRSARELPLLTFAKRGFDTVISARADDQASVRGCPECLACVAVCPVAALLSRSGSG